MSQDEVLTISQTVAEIRSALQDYIEATYHVGDPALVRQRRRLLEEEGVIFRAPYIESTPRYRTERRFADLRLPEAARSLLSDLGAGEGSERILHDPPYTHQAAAIEAVVGAGRSVVVTTGTGSGKTEAFLLPILAKLSVEAAGDRMGFTEPAVRALLLYPMNALVNDQLGRLRLLFGSPLVTRRFTSWAGRPPRFARYTSRTLYPGVRTARKDQDRLKPIERFYVSLLEEAATASTPDGRRSADLIANLRSRGKWPSKPDLQRWYGASGTRWQDSSGRFVRAVMRSDDSELLTRHEVLASPPDILVTNYSMLEYMLMRPLERPIFDATRAWLKRHAEQRFVLVVDEAHLYRGAAGAEVALLLRRLRERLEIPAERLQVICTSASFRDAAHARVFAAQLVGKEPADFDTVQGQLALREGDASGSDSDAVFLAALPLGRFYDATNDQDRRSAVYDLLVHRGADNLPGGTPLALYRALESYPPMSRLVNLTMQAALRVDELGRAIFPTPAPDVAARAVSALVALGSVARPADDEPGLLPCRVHAFFRGLPGLWACVDPNCPEVPPDCCGGPAGRLYSQPRVACACGARVFELYTCRHCGAAYFRAYTDNLDEPDFLWSEPGAKFRTALGEVTELLPIDLLAEERRDTRGAPQAEPADLDMVTGRLNPQALGDRTRRVLLRANRAGASGGHSEDDDDGTSDAGAGGEYKPCGVCGRAAGYGRSSVQDHQTKGDQPFQALVARQISVQPPSPKPATPFAPLRGRKVLVFSDSRQTAARLAPNIQTYSLQDAIRPAILRGWRELESVEVLAPSLSLEDLYLAVLVGVTRLGIRLRPELKGAESLHALGQVAQELSRNTLTSPASAVSLRTRAGAPPESLLRTLLSALTDRFYGLESLALASIRERHELSPALEMLPPIPGVATTTPEKLALARLWLSRWAGPSPGVWFQHMPQGWWLGPHGVRHHTGRFAPIERWLGATGGKRDFERSWLPKLLDTFCERVPPNKYRMVAQNLALDVTPGWGYCGVCRTTQRPFPGAGGRCINCGLREVREIDPGADAVFTARKGYYRGSSARSLQDPPEHPMVIIAAEHTAQLNSAQAEEVFSKAEEHELLFQDVDLGSSEGRPAAAIDVLSCTTTMEVGIDIGALSGVALRNMPPARSSYQQRSGRAGRRGNAVATVVAFGSVDTHDEHHFAEPDELIRGPVEEPTLTLDNAQIVRRHVTAYLFQRYHLARLPEIDPAAQPQLFEVLGTVDGFLGSASPLNRHDFAVWLAENEAALQAAVGRWLPVQLAADDRSKLLGGLVGETLDAVDRAVGTGDPSPEVTTPEVEGDGVDAPAEVNEDRPTTARGKDTLLGRLLLRGVLPSYAFPTDVASFHVFDRERSTRFRPVDRYAPSQSLAIALTQYAPGKEIWIDGKLWTSGALYSPLSEDLRRAWDRRQLYFECSTCNYACTVPMQEAHRGDVRACPACGSADTFGAAQVWLRPPGFAHPVLVDERLSGDDAPATSYATRAKLVAPGPSHPAVWIAVTPRLRQHYQRAQLLVTNSGPAKDGYTYCRRCGLIEPSALRGGKVGAPHQKPYPDERDQNCPSGMSTHGLVLGTDFYSDVLLLSLSVEAPFTLLPGLLATNVALRTLAEALTIAATRRLELDVDEVQAEFRPALTAAGQRGLEAEIYIYDTLPGGAGFARAIGELGPSLFDDAIALLEKCPAGCDGSCYRCLRSFKNRFEHELLDRQVGASLLRYLVSGSPAGLDPSRLDRAADRLYEDLRRQNLAAVRFERDAAIEVPGVGRVRVPIAAHGGARTVLVGVHNPLTPNYVADEQLEQTRREGTAAVLLVDEIVVSRNLPQATLQVVEALR